MPTVTSVQVPHIALCGPSLTLSPWTTAENKLSPDEGYSLGETHSTTWVFPQLLTSVWFYSSCNFILIISVPPAKPVAFVFSRVEN